MQTFLPYADFHASAKCLDDQRLGKQRSECLQLLLAQYTDHPASKMWRGYEGALLEYGKVICIEWRNRGNEDSVLDTLISFGDHKIELPNWLGGSIHGSHRASLMRKDWEHYCQFNWEDFPGQPYVWPRSDRSEKAPISFADFNQSLLQEH